MERNNTSISFRDFIAISEGKQVGTIYHFTRQQSLLDMIESDFNLESHQDYVSFTRNYNLLDYEKTKNEFSFDWLIGDKRGVRISIDGDNLSNKYKIDPFLDNANKSTRNSGESEERIKKKRVSISCCIKQIDVMGDKEAFMYIKEKMNEYNKDIIVEHVKNISLLKKVK